MKLKEPFEIHPASLLIQCLSVRIRHKIEETRNDNVKSKRVKRKRITERELIED